MDEHIESARKCIGEALSVLEEPHVGNAENRLHAALAELGCPAAPVDELQDKIEDLVSAALGTRLTAAIPWTDVVNADPIADLKAWIAMVKRARELDDES